MKIKIKFKLDTFGELSIEIYIAWGKDDLVINDVNEVMKWDMSAKIAWTNWCHQIIWQSFYFKFKGWRIVNIFAGTVVGGDFELLIS